MRKLPPIHPGEILHEEFMEPLGITINGLARALHVPPNRISGIVNGRRSITLDTAMRLARYFDMTVDFWMNLQQFYDIRLAEPQMKTINKQVKPLKRPTTPQAT